MAAPPGSRAVQPVLEPGDLLAGRYRLVRPVPPAVPEDAGPAVLWLAQDEVLARPVAVKVLRAAGRRGVAAARPFLEAAAASGALSHPALARVYDAAVEQRPAQRAGRPAGEVDVAYVISEWVDGPGLARELLENGPYEPAEAVALLEPLAEALAAAHARGLVHGRLHLGNVLLTRGGAVKLTDLGTSAVLPDRAVPADRADDPTPQGADVRDLAAVVYAALTARWPTSATPQPTGGLAAAPTTREAGRDRGRLTSPRQVRAGVPRALDVVVTRALDPRAGEPFTTAGGLQAALDGAVRAEVARTAPPPVRAPRAPRWVRRLVPPVAVVALLAALGAGTYTLGRSVGTIETPEDRLAALASPSPGAGASPVGERIPLTGLTVTDFDPGGGDGERAGEVPNAYDDDDTTAWRTERYDTADLGGGKDGVGLLVDLGRPTPLGRVELVVATDGTAIEVRAADARGATAAQYPRLAQGVSKDGTLALPLPAGTRARFVLVWIIRLPRVDGRFVAGIDELRLLRP